LNNANADDEKQQEQEEKELEEEKAVKPVVAKKAKKRQKKAPVAKVEAAVSEDIVDISNFEEESKPVMPNNQYTASRSNSIAQSRANRRIRQEPK